MWPDSLYARPTGSFRQPVEPPATDPNSGPCRVIRVNPDWLPYIRGALTQLFLETTWNVTGSALDTVQGQVSDLIAMFDTSEEGDCQAPFVPPGGLSSGIELEDCMACCIRWNQGVLEVLSCGVWTPVQGASGGVVPAPNQPGGGTTQPEPGGGCVQYHAVIPGTGWWLAPVAVHTGDEITISNVQGATYDHANTAWFCPDGGQFILGINTGNLVFDPSAQLPDVPVNKIILGFSPEGSPAYSTFYDITPGTPFVVPSDVDGQQLILVTNFVPSIGGNAGEDTCDIVYCNNSVPTWSHTYNFASERGSFLNNQPCGNDETHAAGVYTPLVGWELSNVACDSGGNLKQVVLQLPLPSGCHVTGYTATFSLADVDYDSNTVDSSWEVSAASGNLTLITMPTEPTSPQAASGDVNGPVLQIVLSAGYANGSDAPGSGILMSLSINGYGPTPTF